MNTWVLYLLPQLSKSYNGFFEGEYYERKSRRFSHAYSCQE